LTALSVRWSMLPQRHMSAPRAGDGGRACAYGPCDTACVPWSEIHPERVSDRDTVSFRFRVIGDSIANAWMDALKMPGPRPHPAPGSVDSRTVRIGVGSMEGELKPSPQWWNDAWLTRQGHPYEGGTAEELTATAPIGPHAYDFDHPGASVWVVLNYAWTPAGSFIELTGDPAWAENLLEPGERPNSPPVTVPDPDTHDPAIAGIRRVWLRENPRELWSSGSHGWGWRLHSFTIEESVVAVHLTALVGRTVEYEALLKRGQSAVPAIALGWTVCSTLDIPLGERKVYFRTRDT
jgi:hypothetical protein